MNLYQNTLFRIIIILAASCVYVVTFGAPDDRDNYQGILGFDLITDGSDEMIDDWEKHRNEESFKATDIRDKAGRSIFHQVAVRGTFARFEYWVKIYGGDNFNLMDIRDAAGGTILHYIVLYGTLEQFKFFVNWVKTHGGANLDIKDIIKDIRDADGRTLLDYATIREGTELRGLLGSNISINNATLNRVTEMRTYLMDNYFGGVAGEIVDRLKEHLLADVNIIDVRDADGGTTFDECSIM